MPSNSPTASNALDGLTPALDPARILDALQIGILVVNTQGSVLFRNAAAGRWLQAGATLESALRSARISSPFESWPAELAGISRELRPRQYEIAIALPGASQPERSFTCLVDRAHFGAPCETFVFQLVKINAAVAGDEQNEIAHRLASLGKMAARVAHELNNPLDGILRYVNLALRLAGDAPEPRLKAYLSESRTGLLRMIEIISDLLEYSRATAGAFDEISINEVVEQAVRSTAERADAGRVVVAVDFQTMQMPAVRGGRLYQVCCNVIRNAIDAMPGGGRLSVATGLSGPDAVIRIADTGSGLPNPPEKVFEPFYTTKPPGKGTGLGLSICRDFVEEMGGTITAARGEHGGAVLTIRIPISRCLAADVRRSLGAGPPPEAL
jgi:signal transduction histidine kinase